MNTIQYNKNLETEFVILYIYFIKNTKAKSLFS